MTNAHPKYKKIICQGVVAEEKHPHFDCHTSHGGRGSLIGGGGGGGGDSVSGGGGGGGGCNTCHWWEGAIHVTGGGADTCHQWGRGRYMSLVGG